MTWNTERWQVPSGTLGKSTSQATFEGIHGFGYEEWLFDRSKLFDGYHYAFLQCLNLITDLHVGNPYRIILYTFSNQGKAYFAGELLEATRISGALSQEVYKYYKGKGWIEDMRKSLLKAGGDVVEFDRNSAETFFNVRFKIHEVREPDDLIEIDNNDVNITTDHFKLLPQKNAMQYSFFEEVTNDETDSDDGKYKDTRTRRRTYKSEQEYAPYHDDMQNEIAKFLKRCPDYKLKSVEMERSWVDIRAITNAGKVHFFEIKTDTPKRSIRHAVGQILEYCYYPDLHLADELIIVGDSEPDEDTIRYLNHLRSLFDIPFCYRYWNWETHTLSDNY